MTRWTHKPAVIGGRMDPGDRLVLCDGRPVGRVHPTIQIHDLPTWAWYVWTVPTCNGLAATQAEALEAVRRGVADITAH